MVRFVFWNVMKLARCEMIAQLAVDTNADFILVAECSEGSDAVIGALRRRTGKEYFQPFSPPGAKIKLFTSLDTHRVVPVYDEELGRLSVRRIDLGKTEILLAIVHFVSKVNWSDGDQDNEAQEVARTIREIEDDFRHRRTVVIGDFNMNPFQRGVASSHGFHGVMTRRIAESGSRTVLGKEFPYFYNPMWGFFGDGTPGPPGTHFFHGSTPLTYFWNIFDQVLIRPELLGVFRHQVRIIDSIGGESLATVDGRPCLDKGSDHFPLFFELDVSS